MYICRLAVPTCRLIGIWHLRYTLPCRAVQFEGNVRVGVSLSASEPRSTVIYLCRYVPIVYLYAVSRPALTAHTTSTAARVNAIRGLFPASSRRVSSCFLCTLARHAPSSSCIFVAGRRRGWPPASVRLVPTLVGGDRCIRPSDDHVRCNQGRRVSVHGDYRSLDPPCTNLRNRRRNRRLLLSPRKIARELSTPQNNQNDICA